jgi:protease-4
MVREKLTSARTAAYVVAVTLALVTAAALAPVVWSVASVPGSDEPSVAVITLRGGTDAPNVNRVKAQLRAAREDGSVAAVVLRIDSPGGPVTSSEEFYLAVNRTASEMPVVAYVEGLAASGGYYGIAPADTIFVKPSSTVGSIGVIVQAPLNAVEQAEQQRETFVRTGPDKAQISPDSIRDELELLQRAFVGTVMRHRGDELRLSRDEVANADVYLGPEAVRNGFADRIGDTESAIQRAARLAEGIQGNRYDVEYWGPTRGLDGGASSGLGGLEGAERVVEADGDVYVVVSRSPTEDEFVRPVRFWAVWGVPADTAEYGPVTNASDGATASGAGTDAGTGAAALGGERP